ncbi:hypothetical protein JOC55_003626 [Paenibacillus sacheonensis]|nr:hypothetical protein [Paenibacillus sacheonensis]
MSRVRVREGRTLIPAMGLLEVGQREHTIWELISSIWVKIEPDGAVLEVEKANPLSRRPDLCLLCNFRDSSSLWDAEFVPFMQL